MRDAITLAAGYRAQYDGGGQRVQADLGGELHDFSFIGGELFFDSHQGKRYHPGGGEGTVQVGNQFVSCYHADGAGNQRYGTDVTGNGITHAARFDLYGNQTASFGSNPSVFGFGATAGLQKNGPVRQFSFAGSYYDSGTGTSDLGGDAEWRQVMALERARRTSFGAAFHRHIAIQHNEARAEAGIEELAWGNHPLGTTAL